jgi:hypothetical protein
MQFSTTMSNKARLGLCAASALPLLAPYELLIKPAWSNYLSWAWLFAATISLCALAVSTMLLLTATMGISRRVQFDTEAKMVRVTESSLILRPRVFTYSFLQVGEIEVLCNDWSDGPSTYELRLAPGAGKPFTFGYFIMRVDAEATLCKLNALMEKFT